MPRGDPRTYLALRVNPDAIDAADAAAAAEGTDRSTVIRRWLSLGRRAEAAGWTPPGAAPPRPSSAHGPAVIDATTHAKLQKKDRHS